VRVLRGVRGGNGGNVAYIDKHRLINMYIDNKGDKNTPKIPPNTYDAKHNTNVTNLL